jgi:hypothetical protein
MRRKNLPDGDDLLNPAEAAALWNKVLGAPCVLVRACSEETMRRLCKSGALERAGVTVLAMPGRYYISRRSLLALILKRCGAARSRAEEEAGKAT